MLSSVFLSGRLADKLEPNLRIVEVDRIVPGPGGKFVSDRFPVRPMTGEYSPIMREKEGTIVVLKGRLEMDPKLGLIIIGELEETYRATRSL